MQNLKPVYDAAVAAEAKVREIMADMLAAFEEGTEEGKQRALAMRESLEEAQAAARQANELYVSMRDAQADADAHARKFIPIGEKPANKAKQMTRAEFEALSPAERMDFALKGGIIVEVEE